MKSVEQRLKEVIEFTQCPQTGDEHYGKWGILPAKQRVYLHKLAQETLNLIEEMDKIIRKEYIDNLQAIKKLFKEAQDEFLERVQNDEDIDYDEFISEKFYIAGYRKAYPIKLCEMSDKEFNLTKEDAIYEKACEDCEGEVKKRTAFEIFAELNRQKRKVYLFSGERSLKVIDFDAIQELFKKYGVENEEKTT